MNQIISMKHGTINVQIKEENGGKQLQKKHVVWKIKKSGKSYVKQMCQMTEG